MSSPTLQAKTTRIGKISSASIAVLNCDLLMRISIHLQLQNMIRIPIGVPANVEKALKLKFIVGISKPAVVAFAELPTHLQRIQTQTSL